MNKNKRFTELANRFSKQGFSLDPSNERGRYIINFNSSLLVGNLSLDEARDWIVLRERAVTLVNELTHYLSDPTERGVGRSIHPVLLDDTRFPQKRLKLRRKYACVELEEPTGAQTSKLRKTGLPAA